MLNNRKEDDKRIKFNLDKNLRTNCKRMPIKMGRKIYN